MKSAEVRTYGEGNPVSFWTFFWGRRRNITPFGACRIPRDIGRFKISHNWTVYFRAIADRRKSFLVTERQKSHMFENHPLDDLLNGALGWLTGVRLQLHHARHRVHGVAVRAAEVFHPLQDPGVHGLCIRNRGCPISSQAKILEQICTRVKYIVLVLTLTRGAQGYPPSGGGCIGPDSV